MNLSSQGIHLLQSIETLALQPYDDQNGKTINAWCKGATIGYGHLIAKNDWSKYQNSINQNDAEQLFQSDLAPFVKTVNNKVTATVSQSEFDALVILTFNIGAGNFNSSSVLKLVNDPTADTSYPTLESAWKAWNKSHGKVMRGLEKRRQAEWDIYSKGLYQTW
jgi:GH24 family phage-related lysozyme (muramidase)